jgi:cellulose synthase/poly-beta-1,6-N-acetylglucosamine synthase-like glycosyltransferase
MPRRSARRTFHIAQLLAFAALGFGVYWAARAAPALSLNVLHALAWAFFAFAIGWRVLAAASLKQPMSRIAAPTQWPIYTILCPVYREANVVADLIGALDRLDYPKAALQILVLVEADDAETKAALAFAGAPHIEIVEIPVAAPRTNPKALNIGLARARGEFIVVYDAEDRPHPQQLRVALAAFEDGGAELACVQAPRQIDNANISWIAAHFAAEYAIQFRELLPLLARCGLPLPLGGSSNHFRTELLRAAGGWDPYNVTEDADLGYRFARDGYRSGVIWAPTAEEAPVTFAAWRKQRTRWIKGHMQTWLVLMRNPWRTAREMGMPAFLSMQLMLGGGIIASFAHGPLALLLLVAALTPYDLSPADFILAIFGYSVAIFAAVTASVLSRDLRHIGAAPTMPFYWPLASIAAFGAFFALLFRPHHWAKTQHGLSSRPLVAGARDQRSDFNRALSASTSASG